MIWPRADAINCGAPPDTGTRLMKTGVVAAILVALPIEGAAIVDRRPDSLSRFSRFKSARTSAACWYRTSRSFSRALAMIRSSSSGTCGLLWRADVGSRFRIASWITPVVRPENACWPVAISYSTAPNENRSVRASRSSPRTCSGDM